MTVSTRRERRQQQRRQQQRRATNGGGGARGVSQLWIALGIVVLLVAVVLVGRASGVFDAPATSKTPDVNAVDVSGAKIGTHQDNIGNAHIPTGQHGNYTEGLPPTSGEHYAAPAGPVPWGIKSSFIQFESTTHNLEHGGVVILYNGLDKTQLDQLTSVVKSLNSSGFNKIVVEPWPDMKDAKVILTAWDWILKLQAPDDTSVVKFVRQHTDDEAPENGTP